jgi:hypothetical protein
MGDAAGRLAQGYGHLELGYDFATGAEADGWIHAIFRYTRRDTGHSAETSFGSHMFNVPATWRSEPNSYLGKPPGLSTRLYLRLTDRPGRRWNRACAASRRHPLLRLATDRHDRDFRQGGAGGGGRRRLCDHPRYDLPPVRLPSFYRGTWWICARSHVRVLTLS